MEQMNFVRKNIHTRYTVLCHKWLSNMTCRSLTLVQNGKNSVEVVGQGGGDILFFRVGFTRLANRNVGEKFLGDRFSQ